MRSRRAKGTAPAVNRPGPTTPSIAVAHAAVASGAVQAASSPRPFDAELMSGARPAPR